MPRATPHATHHMELCIRLARRSHGDGSAGTEKHQVTDLVLVRDVHDAVAHVLARRRQYPLAGARAGAREDMEDAEDAEDMEDMEDARAPSMSSSSSTSSAPRVGRPAHATCGGAPGFTTCTLHGGDVVDAFVTQDVENEVLSCIHGGDLHVVAQLTPSASMCEAWMRTELRMLDLQDWNLDALYGTPAYAYTPYEWAAPVVRDVMRHLHHMLAVLLFNGIQSADDREAARAFRAASADHDV